MTELYSEGKGKGKGKGDDNVCSNPVCPGLPTDKLRLCSGCKFNYYCSPTCSKQHWKKHKKDCKNTKEFLHSLGDRDQINRHKCSRKQQKKIVERLTQEASQGDMWAMFNLGVCYEHGQSVQQSYKRALEFYEMAAVKGVREAWFMIGVYRENGHGTPKNEKEAFRCYQRAAELGDLDGQMQVALFNETGKNTPRNHKKAFEWYTVAASNGCVVARLKLASYYHSGVVTTKDDDKAFRYYQEVEAEAKTMKKGGSQKMLDFAQIKIAEYHTRGFGVVMNKKKAFECWHVLAKRKKVVAQLSLASCYLYGQGTDNNTDLDLQ